jgi:hypothetical protein
MTHAEYLERISPTVCARLRECNPEDFAESFSDAGVARCADVLRGISQRPEDPIKCTDAEVELCVNEIKGQACAELGYSPFTLPERCTRCV